MPRRARMNQPGLPYHIGRSMRPTSTAHVHPCTSFSGVIIAPLIFMIFKSMPSCISRIVSSLYGNDPLPATHDVLNYEVVLGPRFRSTSHGRRKLFL